MIHVSNYVKGVPNTGYFRASQDGSKTDADTFMRVTAMVDPPKVLLIGPALQVIDM